MDPNPKNHSFPAIMNRLVASTAILLTLAALRCEAQESVKSAASLPIPLLHKKPEELKLKHSAFTFVRVKYAGVGRRRTIWMTDYPDSDLNLTARVEKEIGLKTDPKGKVLELTDPKLKEYPFLYVVEGGSMRLSQVEADALRDYLQGGGFLMVDDFWGEAEWTSLQAEIKKAFPNHELTDLSLDHPVFHAYYEIREKPQVPSIAAALQHQATGITWECEDCKEPHYRGLFDAAGRLMAIFCHNTDLGDGWERVGDDEYYSREFSLKRALPMGVNIVVYALSQ
jgi:hypothetical protein